MKMKITLHGVSYEVEVEVLDEGEGFYDKNNQMPKIISSVSATPVYNTTAVPPKPHSAAPTAKQITSPVGGTIVEVKLRAGDKVTAGQEILILEAMKMHTAICAPAEGVIKNIPVAAGDTVREGQVIVEFQ